MIGFTWTFIPSGLPFIQQLIVDRNTVDSSKSFIVSNGNASQLISHIEAVVYDGATSLGQLKATR